jgi:hypothetical protein
MVATQEAPQAEVRLQRADRTEPHALMPDDTPMSIDITDGWVGDRAAIVVSFPKGARVELTVRGEGVTGEVKVSSSGLYEVPHGLRSLAEAGVSLGHSYGQTVTSLQGPSNA